MGLFSSIKQLWDDFCLWLAQNKLKFFANLFVAIGGFVLGIVLFANNSESWWYYNRCDYVHLLMWNGFLSVLFRLTIQTALILVVTVLSQMHKYMRPICYVALFIGCIYNGANLACLFAVIGVVAILYIPLYTLPSVVMLLFACLNFSCVTDYVKSIAETIRDCKKQLFAICFVSLTRILLLFLILRPLSCSI